MFWNPVTIFPNRKKAAQKREKTCNFGCSLKATNLTCLFHFSGGGDFFSFWHFLEKFWQDSKTSLELEMEDSWNDKTDPSHSKFLVSFNINLSKRCEILATDHPKFEGQTLGCQNRSRVQLFISHLLIWSIWKITKEKILGFQNRTRSFLGEFTVLAALTIFCPVEGHNSPYL